MTEWKAKRFWKTVGVEKDGQGYVVVLDNRRLRTPAKAEMVLPSRPLAERIAREWDAQEGVIAPLSMPVTRMANSAIDRVSPQRAEVAQMLAEYGGTDLVCYRAEHPDALVAEQSKAWDPILDWLHATYGFQLVTTQGIGFVKQPRDSLMRLSAEVHAMTPFQLAAFHDLVALSGSLAIGLAASRDAFAVETLWAACRIDEDWQQTQWGQDEEAAEAAEIKRTDFFRAYELFKLV